LIFRRRQYLDNLHRWGLRKYTNAETKDILCDKLLDDFNHGRELSYVTLSTVNNLRRHCREKRPDASPMLVELLQSLCHTLQGNVEDRPESSLQPEEFPLQDDAQMNESLAEWSLVEADLMAISMQTPRATWNQGHESASDMGLDLAPAEEETSTESSEVVLTSFPTASIASAHGIDHVAASIDLPPSLVNQFAIVSGDRIIGPTLRNPRASGGNVIELEELMSLTKNYFLASLQNYQRATNPRNTVAYQQSKSFWTSTKSAIYFLKKQDPWIAWPLLNTASLIIPDLCKTQPLTFIREILTTLAIVNARVQPGLRSQMLQVFISLLRNLEPTPENVMLTQICSALNEEWITDEHLTMLVCTTLRTAEENLVVEDEEIFELERARIQLLRRRGDLAAAEAKAEMAQEKAERLFDKNSDRTRRLMAERLYIMNEQHMFAKALDLAEEIIDRTRANEGSEFPNSERAIYEIEDLAEAYERLGRVEEAAFWLRKALRAALRVWSNREATLHINDKLEKLHLACGRE
jgi:tetratricopeptide (TPR) repeat protein